jgi:hypothetical protein
LPCRRGSRRSRRRGGIWVGVLVVTAFFSVWLTAFHTTSYQARLAFTGLPALACLAALGMEHWKLPIRFLSPLMGLVGTVIAAHNDVFGVRWRWREIGRTRR